MTTNTATMGEGGMAFTRESDADEILALLTVAGAIIRPPKVVAENTLAMVEGKTDRAWDQYVWFDHDSGDPMCGTTCCIAGDAVLQTGLSVSEGKNLRVVEIGPYEVTWGAFARSAQALLGLTDDQADWLFHADRAKAEVVWALEHIRDGLGWDGMEWNQ